MPLQKCSEGGKSGWRWGSKGRCYPGPEGKKKAIKQGLAIDPQEFKAKAEGWRGNALMQAVADNIMVDVATGYISKKQRDSIDKSDFAWPEERKFPITSQQQVDSAAKLLGRAPADKQASIKRLIIEIAKRKGFKVPESWA